MKIGNIKLEELEESFNNNIPEYDKNFFASVIWEVFSHQGGDID